LTWSRQNRSENKNKPRKEGSHTSSNYSQWDNIYRRYSLNTLGWELGKPRPILVEFVENGKLTLGRVLDLCCGAGSNTVYMAEQGFEVVGMDVSPTAIGFAQKKAWQATVQVDFGLHSFVWLPFKDGAFDFVFDMGCFHHVEPEDRSKFIQGVHRVLRRQGVYMLTCFSWWNGPAWNHFTKQQLEAAFGTLFKFKIVRHYASAEGDGYTRFFYTVLMEKK
jgi:SAM-dependent methyltransferase